MSISKGDAICSSRVDPCVHACHLESESESEIVIGSRERVARFNEGGHIPTAYFFAGGSAKLPSVKLEAYCLFFDTRFSWTAEGMSEFDDAVLEY